MNHERSICHMIDEKMKRIENGLSYLDHEIKCLKLDFDMLGKQVDRLFEVYQRIREMVDELKNRVLD